MWRSWWAICAAICCWPMISVAADGTLENLLGGGTSAPAAAEPEFSVSFEPAGARPLNELKVGDELVVAVRFQVPDGHHGNLPEITINEAKSAGIEPVADQEWTPTPPVPLVFDPAENRDVPQYTGTVVFRRRMRLTLPLRDVRLEGQFEANYCDKTACRRFREKFQLVPSITSKSRETPAVAAADKSAAPQYQVAVSKPHVDFKVQLSPEQAKPGDVVTLTIRAELAKGWHIFSTSQQGIGGEPTVGKLTELAGLEELDPVFQADRQFEVHADSDGNRQEYYEHEVTWTRRFRVRPRATTFGMQGELTYQVCETACVRGKIGFKLGDLTQAEQFVESTGPRVRDQGLVMFLLTAFGFGFVSLLTPCVFPMVPITVSFFLKQSEKQHSNPLKLAIVYCLSIVLTFTVLGVGIAAVFGATGLNQLANHPWLNIGIGLMFATFALNMLGMFEITMPGWLLTMSAEREARGGLIGAFFMAMTFTLTSFTCTFAFAGTLLVEAARGDYFWPILGMLSFGTAFAFPFFLLALFPSLLKSLPKSGGWMNSVKVVMGLLELGAAVKFLSVADAAMNGVPLLFDFTLVMLIWLVLSLLSVAYLLGWYRFHHDTPTEGISVLRALFALSYLILAGFLTIGLASEHPPKGVVMSQILALAPPQFNKSANTAYGPGLDHHGVVFSLDVKKATDYAAKIGKPMLIDFTGVNCANCRLMEGRLSEPALRQLLGEFICVQAYVDVPRVPTVTPVSYAEELAKSNQQLQASWFEDVTMPSYVVATPDGKTILAQFIGAEQAPGTKFAEFLAEGLEKWKSQRK